MTTNLSANIQMKSAVREKMRQQQEEFFSSGGKITTPKIVDRAGYHSACQLNQKQRKSAAKMGINHVNR